MPYCLLKITKYVVHCLQLKVIPLAVLGTQVFKLHMWNPLYLATLNCNERGCRPTKQIISISMTQNSNPVAPVLQIRVDTLSSCVWLLEHIL
jgi:hypothetical protein